MSIYCEVEYDDWDGDGWRWQYPNGEIILNTKRSRKCCSCKSKISVGDVCSEIPRYRHATEWEEDHNLGEEFPLASWYFCETCGDLAESLREHGLCYELGRDLRKQIEEYIDENGKI